MQIQAAKGRPGRSQRLLFWLPPRRRSHAQLLLAVKSLGKHRTGRHFSGLCARQQPVPNCSGDGQRWNRRCYYSTYARAASVWNNRASIGNGSSIHCHGLNRPSGFRFCTCLQLKRSSAVTSAGRVAVVVVVIVINAFVVMVVVFRPVDSPHYSAPRIPRRGGPVVAVRVESRGAERVQSSKDLVEVLRLVEL
ncbi:hypothetical protein DFJ73DRAFT_808290 [Zopfochytrium polystomum]|nr:hypothetical protein DFJ73DRAFT_808290 [Zopfochytrium polystomum]